MSKKSNIVIIYRSKSGHTKNYADWLAKELNCDLFKGNEVSTKDLIKYDTIIYGGGLYAGGINGAKQIIKHYDQLKDKKLIIFAVGATPNREETTAELRKMNIPAELQDKISFFYLRGGFDYSKLTPFNKFLMTLMKLKLKRIKNPDADQKGMLASYTHPLDLTNRKNLEPMLKSIRMEG